MKNHFRRIVSVIALLAIALFTTVGAARKSAALSTHEPAPTASTAPDRDKDDIEDEDEDEEDDDGNLSATLTAEEAAVIANLEVPGKIGKVELENENGVAVYGVEIAATDGSQHDVKVDANTGKVLKDEAGDDEDEGHGKKEKAEKEDN